MASGRCAVLLLLLHFLFRNDATAFQFQSHQASHGSSHDSGSPFEFSSSRQGFSSSRPSDSLLTLFMGKGLGGAKNKQIELAKKMALAKIKQRDDGDDDSVSESASAETKEDKVSKERSEFAKLLANSPPPSVKKEPQAIQNEDIFRKLQPPKPPVVSTGPKVTSKDLKRKRKAAEASNKESSQGLDPSEGTPDRLQLGSTARRRDFELLVEVETSKPLGPMKAASLVPWVPPFLSNYLVVLADPRRQSTDLYKSIQYLEALSSSQSSETMTKTIVISADSVPEMLAWKKRSNLGHVLSVRMLEDPSLEWMKTYDCIPDVDRWSMCVLVIDSSGIIRHHSREVDPARVCQLVSEAIATTEEEDS
jgi:hypothetical protein